MEEAFEHAARMRYRDKRQNRESHSRVRDFRIIYIGIRKSFNNIQVIKFLGIKIKKNYIKLMKVI